jgi:tRNA A-37 threonylcarbamoyl transferase component Bud32
MKWPNEVSDDLSYKRGVKGLRWTIAEETAQWLSSLLLDDLKKFLRKHPPQKILKVSLVRTVSIISGPRGRLFLKRYKIRGLKEQLKYLVVPSKARKEWLMARQALRKGISTPVPLAMAERRTGRFLRDAFLITQAIIPSSPLIELIPDGKQKTLLSQTAQLIRKAHEAGLFHQDLHAGNILVGSKKKRLYLIDLHRSKFVRSLSKRRRLWNLAQFFYSLKGLISTEEKKVFLNRYDQEEKTFNKRFEEALRRIERVEERIYRRHMRSRTKRCLKNSGGFYVTQEDGWRIWARREWKTQTLLKLIKKHQDIVAKDTDGLIKTERRSAISLFNYKKTRMCVKEYRYQGGLGRIKDYIRRSKARTGWLMGNGLVVRGISGILPLALLERKKRGVLKEAFLIMESPPGYCELDRYMVGIFGTSHHKKTKKQTFLKALASFMAELYLLKIAHGDLKTCNIMVREEHKGWEFGVVDMDDIRLDRDVRPRRFVKELIQLHTSTPLFIGMDDRITFLRRYLRLIGRDDIREIINKVIKGSRGRQLVYVAPQGDVIMDVDWEEACASGCKSSLSKEDV